MNWYERYGMISACSQTCYNAAMNRRTAPAALLIIFCLSGCATPTGYQKLTGRFGYNDFRIAADTFEVTFTGNGLTPWETVSSYVLRRAAEVTIFYSYSHFVVLDRSDQSKTYIRGTDKVTATVVRPATRLRIRCFKDPLPDLNELIDARDFLVFNYPEAVRELEIRDKDGKVIMHTEHKADGEINSVDNSPIRDSNDGDQEEH